MKTQELSNYLIKHPKMVMYWDIDPLYSGIKAHKTVKAQYLDNLTALREKVKNLKGCTSSFFSFWTNVGNAVRKVFKWELALTDNEKLQALDTRIKKLIKRSQLDQLRKNINGDQKLTPVQKERWMWLIDHFDKFSPNRMPDMKICDRLVHLEYLPTKKRKDDEVNAGPQPVNNIWDSNSSEEDRIALITQAYGQLADRAKESDIRKEIDDRFPEVHRAFIKKLATEALGDAVAIPSSERRQWLEANEKDVQEKMLALLPEKEKKSLQRLLNFDTSGNLFLDLKNDESLWKGTQSSINKGLARAYLALIRQEQQERILRLMG